MADQARARKVADRIKSLDAEFVELCCVGDDLVVGRVADQSPRVEGVECCSARWVVGGRAGRDPVDLLT